MNICNYGILDPVPTDPAGYITKDGMWAAVPYGNKFVIIHNGQQVHTCNNYKTAKSYIQKEVKSRSKNKTATLEKFL
jgi:ABC-type uncharacterized transport system ATPase component